MISVRCKEPCTSPEGQIVRNGGLFFHQVLNNAVASVPQQRPQTVLNPRNPKFGSGDWRRCCEAGASVVSSAWWTNKLSYVAFAILESFVVSLPLTKHLSWRQENPTSALA